MRARVLIIVLALLFGCFGASHYASAAPENPDTQTQDEKPKDSPKKKEGDCAGGIPGLEQVCDAGEGAVGLIDKAKDAPGEIAAGAAESAVDQMTEWMTDAATWTTKQIVEGIQKTSTPELEASWYEERFESMAALGIGLSMLVAMIALCSAALRRDPDALGATVLGMLRAGFGTGLVIALTVMALKVGDDITNFVAGETIGKRSTQFWKEVGDAWGQDNFAGLGSSAIAFLLAFVQVVAGLIVWIEMIVRNAAIYVAVLFMPFALAAAIWPSMREWQSRLAKVLFILIAMKPVIVTVLALAAYAAKAGITGEAEGDIGVLLAAIVIFALAALSPWALLHLISLDHETTRSVRSGAMAARQSTQRIGGALAAPGGAAMRTLNSRGGGGGGPPPPLTGGGPSGGGGGPSGPGGGSPPAGGGTSGRSSRAAGHRTSAAVNASGAVAAAAGMAGSAAAAGGSEASRVSGGQLGTPGQTRDPAGGQAQHAVAGASPGAPGGRAQTDTARARTNAADQRPPRPAAPGPRPGGSGARSR